MTTASRTCGSSAQTATRHSTRTAAATGESLEELLAGIGTEGYEAVGRRYDVSGNAIRKWVRAHGVEPPPGPGRVFNPPPRPPAVLDDDEARWALDLLAAGTSTYAIAHLLGVSQQTIRPLRRGITYRHIERPQALRQSG